MRESGKLNRSDFGTAIWHARLLVPAELFSFKLLGGKENLSCPMLRRKEERNGDSLSPQDSVSARQNLPNCSYSAIFGLDLAQSLT
jgi:hypothetical protein